MLSFHTHHQGLYRFLSSPQLVRSVGVPHPTLGQAVVVVATPGDGGDMDGDGVIEACRQQLPAYMVPHEVVARATLPRNPNGKIDRKSLSQELAPMFDAALA